MSLAHLHQPHHPNKDEPEEFEPGSLPVEPDEGPVPAHVPSDPEHERVIAPAAILARQVPRGRGHVGSAGSGHGGMPTAAHV